MTEPKWKCGAMMDSSPEPVDCNWPHCGCDKVASRVMEALTEEGWLSPSEVAPLQAAADGRMKEAAQLYIKSMRTNYKGEFQLELRASIVPLIAEYLAQTFKAMGGENYVDIEINHDELGPLILRMQRRFGEQPSTVAAKERERAERLEKALRLARKWGIHGKAYDALQCGDLAEWVDKGMVGEPPSRHVEMYR